MGSRAIVGLLALLYLAQLAFAQTGGRTGGGDWGRSNSSSGTSPSRGYSSPTNNAYKPYKPPPTPTPVRTSSPSSGGTSNGKPRDGIGVGWALLISLSPVIAFGLFFGYIVWSARRSRKPKAPPPEAADVSVLHVAVDARARKLLQSELARIANTADTASAQGRRKMLREIAILLRKLRDAWVYGGAVNEPLRDLDVAKPVFDRHVDDARVRFREETITNVQGKHTATAPTTQYVPRSHEGPGLVLVSIILAARTKLFTVNKIASGDELDAALEALLTLANRDLVAVEIVWMPTIDEDRLSSIELEAVHPDLIRITDALVGKVFCTYCTGPHPAELAACPHCGALPVAAAG